MLANVQLNDFKRPSFANALSVSKIREILMLDFFKEI